MTHPPQPEGHPMRRARSAPLTGSPRPLPALVTGDLAERRHRSIVGRRRRLVRRALVISDIVAFTGAFVLAEAVSGFGGMAWRSHLAIGGEIIVFYAALPVCLLIMSLYGLYAQDEERTDHSTADDVMPVFHAVTVAVWLLEAGAWLTGFAHPQLPKLFTFWVAAVGFVLLARAIARLLCQRSDSYIQNTIIVGGDEVGQLLARKLVQHPEYGLSLLGFVDDRPIEVVGPVDGVPYLGTPAALPELIGERDVERVIVAGETLREQDLIHDLKRCDVQIDIVSRLYGVLGPGLDIHSVEGISLVGLRPTRLSPVALAAKRTIDVVGALLALLLTAPLFAWIAWRIRRDSDGPIFFRQHRLGMGMKEMTLLKFRTMRVGTDDVSHRAYISEIMSKTAQPEEHGLFKLERPGDVTPFGAWLRATSLDELPQLINVLKGDMSLVGPRPCLPYEVELYARHHFERFSVPAGMTGLWQVTARARSTYIEALEMDVAYARDWSIGLDLWLLARTPLQLLARRGTL